jgi:hypothetical protein
VADDDITASLFKDGVLHAEGLARALWHESYGLQAMPIQPRHMLGVAVLAMITSRRSAESDAAIDLAAGYLQDERFQSFVREVDVREGLRRYFADTRRAAESLNVPELSECVQTSLVMPAGGPSRLNQEQSRATVACAARIVADAMAASLLLAQPESEQSFTAPASSHSPIASPVSPFVVAQSAGEQRQEISGFEQEILAREAREMGRFWAIADQVFYAVIGQIVIPIPVVGALVGWFVSGWLPGPGDFIGPILLKRKVRATVDRVSRS